MKFFKRLDVLVRDRIRFIDRQRYLLSFRRFIISCGDYILLWSPCCCNFLSACFSWICVHILWRSSLDDFDFWFSNFLLFVWLFIMLFLFTELLHQNLWLRSGVWQSFEQLQWLIRLLSRIVCIDSAVFKFDFHLWRCKWHEWWFFAAVQLLHFLRGLGLIDDGLENCVVLFDAALLVLKWRVVVAGATSTAHTLPDHGQPPIEVLQLARSPTFRCARALVLLWL